MGKILKGALIWEKQLRQIARQQFNDIGSDDQAVLDSTLEDIRDIKKKIGRKLRNKKGKREAKIATRKRERFGRGTMSFLDVERLLDSYKNPDRELRKTYPTVYPVLTSETIDQYMRCICDYVNKLRRPDSENPKNKPKKKGKTDANASDKDTEESEFLSCVFVSTEDFDQMNPGNESWIDAVAFMKQIKCNKKTFMDLDFFLIPYLNPNLGEHGHYSLLGIAPRQQYVFAIDSLEQTTWDFELWPLSGVWEILLSQIAEMGKKAEDAWPVYGEWSSQMYNKTNKNCPNCARQGDLYNCGVFTLTNALCLTFGYDLMCYSNRDLNPLKRPRMFMELSKARLRPSGFKTGFKGKYSYDLLEIPTGPVYFTRRGRSARRVAKAQQPHHNKETDVDNDEDEEFVYVEDKVDGTYEPVPVDSEDSEGHDSDLSEQFGMVNEQEESSNSEAGGSTDHGSSSSTTTPRLHRTLSVGMGEAIETAIVADFMHHVPRRYAAWKEYRKYVRRSELARRDFPPQFNPLYFRKAGIFYPRIEVPLSNRPPRFTEDQTERHAVFAYWRDQNKIAACVETFWSDEVKPFDGMIQGFAEWLEENPRMGVDKLELELGRWEVGFGESKPVTDFASRSGFVLGIRTRMRNSLANLK